MHLDFIPRSIAGLLCDPNFLIQFLKELFGLGLEVQQIITFTYVFYSVIKGSENLRSMCWVEERCEFQLALGN